jgi:recombination directionality factor gp3-like protein
VPIIDLQRRLTQIGVIRLGRQVPTGKTNRRGEPGMRPEKLDRFRVTSPSEALVQAVAATYGGKVEAWKGPSGPEFQVVTDVREFPVLVPPQRIDPNYEAWGPGFRSRLCDGATERMRDQPCLCKQGEDGHVHDFVSGECACGTKRECKPTVRASVMLRDIPSIGTFKIESHGINAAAYGLSSVAEAIETAPVPLPGRLTMELVDKKELTKAGTSAEELVSRKFWVPKLIIDWLTPGQAYGGQIEDVARAALAGQAAAVGGGEQRPAIDAAPADSEPAKDKPGVDFYALAKLARNPEAIRKLWTQAKQTGALDDALAAHLKERAAALEPKPSEVPEPAPDPVAEVVEAEVEPDRDALWMQILAAGKQHGWNLPVLEEKYRGHMGHDPAEEEVATGWMYEAFLTALKNGEVQ